MRGDSWASFTARRLPGKLRVSLKALRSTVVSSTTAGDCAAVLADHSKASSVAVRPSLRVACRWREATFEGQGKWLQGVPADGETMGKFQRLEQQNVGACGRRGRAAQANRLAAAQAVVEVVEYA